MVMCHLWLGTDMADKVHISREVRGPASAPSGEGSSHQFGLTAAMALIVGSIIGVGIFNLPTSLAVYGPITLVSMALTTVGALVLALLFAALSRRLPADGGPYAYARVAFGNRLGAVLPGRRRPAARHPCLPGTAPSHERAGARAALP